MTKTNALQKIVTNKRIMKLKFKRLITTFVFLICLSVTINAQVTVGADKEPIKGALLDLKSDDSSTNGGPTTGLTSGSGGGLLLPRVNLVDASKLLPFITDAEITANPNLKEKLTGLLVYNLSTTNDFDEGQYIWDGATWVKVQDSNSPKWFYMPSFNLDVSTVGTQSVNLYNEYVNQFTKSDSNDIQFVSSNSALTQVQPKIYSSSELDYIVTAYSPSDVLKITDIDASGEMTYEILSTNIPESSYINVIFVVK